MAAPRHVRHVRHVLLGCAAALVALAVLSVIADHPAVSFIAGVGAFVFAVAGEVLGGEQ